jgi:hypothetical protein
MTYPASLIADMRPFLLLISQSAKCRESVKER